MDVDADVARRTIAAMPPAPWHLPWLRVHLYARELLTVPASSPDWLEVKAALVRLSTLRRALVQAGWFN